VGEGVGDPIQTLPLCSNTAILYAEPSEKVLDCAPRWRYDLWYNAIMDLESNKAKRFGVETNRIAMEGG
jgi:hypothetical protein